MNKNSKEPRSSRSGFDRIRNRRHKPLFEEELQEEIKRDDRAEEKAAPAAPAAHTGSKKSGILRTVKIAARVILDEIALFAKKIMANRSSRIITVAAAVCVIGLAAIITVTAAVTARSEENTPPDADLAPVSGRIEEAGGAGTEVNTEIAAVDEKTSETSSETESTESLNSVTVTFWGKESATYDTEATTVGEFITESEIVLTDAQLANIDTSLPIGADITISADVVTYEKETVEEVLEFKTEYRESTLYPAGTTKTTQYGKNGSQSRVFTITYVNGVEVSREQTASWIDSSPVTQIVVKGTGSTASSTPAVTPSAGGGGTFVGSDGVERTYTHYIDVRATCYYVGGTTASGIPADENVIAVDPSVIPLGTKVYVTGNYGDFGVRIAADTGGNIKGYTIDVCIDPNHPLAGTFGWRDMRVYFLA